MALKKKYKKPKGKCPIGPYYPIGQMGCDPERGWHEPSCPTNKGK